MRFTLMLGIGGYQDYVPVAQAADAAGWSSISMPDSIFFPKQTESEYPYAATATIRQYLDGAPFIEPFVAMATMAAVTRRIRFYPGVLKVPVRQPLLLAKSLTSLAVVSGNRVSLGAGIAPWKEDFSYNGLDYDKRGAMMDECIAILRGVMSGQYFEFHGKHYDFGPLKMSPVPDRPVPILVGGHAKPALARAACVGDGWISANTDFATLTGMLEQLAALRRQHGTSRREDFEIHAVVPEATTLDDFRRLRDLGVTDIGTSPWSVHAAAGAAQVKIDAIRRFGDEIIAGFN